MRRALGLRQESSTGETPQRNISQADRRPRRFVRDGEVPVVMIKGHHPHDGDSHAAQERLKASEATLRMERESREAVERRLAETRTQVQSLQAKLAHAELTHGEAIATERRAGEAAVQAAQAAVMEARAGQEEAERAQAEAERAKASAERATATAERAQAAAERGRAAAERDLAEALDTLAAWQAAQATVPTAVDIQRAPEKAVSTRAKATAGVAKRQPRVAAAGRRARPEKEPEPVKWWLPGFRNG